MGVNHKETLELLDVVVNKFNIDYGNMKICDLGNQRMWSSLNIEGLPVTRKGYLLEDYFKILKGVPLHVSVDLNGKNGSLPLDLTKPIKTLLAVGPFQLITNFGTSEHVPGQYWCFKNIHNLCDVGGLMYHVVPKVGNWDGVNCGLKEPHCPYFYNSDFFQQLAELNGYEIVVNKIWNHDHVVPKRAREECVCVYRKVKDTEFVEEEVFSKIPLAVIHNPSKTGNYASGGI